MINSTFFFKAAVVDSWQDAIPVEVKAETELYLEHAGKPALPTISPFSFGRFGEL
jgi:hypothetical protein